MKNNSTVILANGAFPTHEVPLRELASANRIVCCDGATNKLLEFGREPTAIVGDMDSLSHELKEKYRKIIYCFLEQETNDLTKAVNWCVEKGIDEVTILGATGRREDHSLGNIFLLPLYAQKIKVKMLTDYGIFTPLFHSKSFTSYPGQRISIFSLHPEIRIITTNLQYPLTNQPLNALWRGTLNIATDNSFRVEFEEGSVIIFQEY